MAGLLVIAGGLAAAQCALAQAGGTPKNAEEVFDFGPPLRRNVVIAYKYTERVRVVAETNGHPLDSSERTLSYFITERQVPGEKKGLTTIEANVDSMHIEYSDGKKTLKFNTQDFKPSDQLLVKHNEIFVPTVLVNQMVSFTLSPYGEVMKVESPGLDNAMKQASSPEVPVFLRERLRASTTDEFLASVMLPWRSVVPLWRKVPYGKNITMKSSAVLDRVSFRNSSTVQMAKSPDGEPLLRFSAELANPLNKLVTMSSFDDPLTLRSAGGKINGELKLDQDGVVRSGWSIATGTVVGVGGAEITNRVTHEIYVEALGEFAFTSN